MSVTQPHVGTRQMDHMMDQTHIVTPTGNSRPRIAAKGRGNQGVWRTADGHRHPRFKLRLGLVRRMSRCFPF